jgi:hypothetical protein
MYQIAVKLTKWAYNIPTSCIAEPSKIYPNRNFWFEIMPSGNPGREAKPVIINQRRN